MRYQDDPLAAYRAVRRATEALAEPLSPEDCCVQSMTEASPVKWHLAHTTWFFETMVLERAEREFRPYDPSFRVLFNSYYESVGSQHPRPARGMLTRPGLAVIRAYRRQVDERLAGLLASGGLSDQLMGVLELGLHHEQQHQELLLTDVKHLLSLNPSAPVYRELPAPAKTAAAALRWHPCPEQLRGIGDGGEGFAFDNERPRHRVLVPAFELASRLVTNREYQGFVDDGGYERHELWLSDGWATVKREGWRAPIYWRRADGGWSEFTLGGLRPLQADVPVSHVSYFEADAYARWAGARLPREDEWEVAATGDDVARGGNFVEDGGLHPAPAADGGPAPAQMFGDLWEWTGSAYLAYPGYRPLEGALGEYNGKFMSGQMVLRGGSCATPATHIRATYRNFFYPNARWQFSGIRLARDAGEGAKAGRRASSKESR